MIEIVNPMHPDKIADRIAGAMVDLAYKKQSQPKIAVEVLIGHGNAHIIAETSVHLEIEEIKSIVKRISNENVKVDYLEVPQDEHLANNQKENLRCGDNGIFKGSPRTDEMYKLIYIARGIYDKFMADGKYILSDDGIIICQSHANKKDIEKLNILDDIKIEAINPLGDWTGGINVDTGATNRKLGSDMGNAITGGGLHGKDLSKADVSVNIVCDLLARSYNIDVYAKCAIGDKKINFNIGNKKIITMSYSDVVYKAEQVIKKIGGFEKFANWGLNYESPSMVTITKDL